MHRVVERADDIALFQPMIDAQARPGGRPPECHARPVCGRKPAAGSLPHKAAASMAWPTRATSSCVSGKGRPRRRRAAIRPRSTPVRHLGNRVLDLDPRIHLQEIKCPAFVAEQELDRADAAIVDRARRLHCSFAHRGAECRASSRGRALPRQPFDGGAGPSSRARRDAGPGRYGRPQRSGSRHGVAGPLLSRGSNSSDPNAPVASERAAAIRPRRVRAAWTRRIPRPPPAGRFHA